MVHRTLANFPKATLPHQAINMAVPCVVVASFAASIPYAFHRTSVAHCLGVDQFGERRPDAAIVQPRIRRDEYPSDRNDMSRPPRGTPRAHHCQRGTVSPSRSNKCAVRAISVIVQSKTPITLARAVRSGKLRPPFALLRLPLTRNFHDGEAFSDFCR
jgi:hypothetical protein